jgi:hypothetical protein
MTGKRPGRLGCHLLGEKRARGYNKRNRMGEGEQGEHDIGTARRQVRNNRAQTPNK